MAGELVALSVPCDEHAPALVREALAELDESDPLLGDAMLVASELVTNAVRHSGCTPEELLHVQVVRYEGHLMIAVRDPGTSGAEARLIVADAGFTGLGLRVVESLSDRWGQERGDGYRVWAMLPYGPGGATLAG